MSTLHTDLSAYYTSRAAISDNVYAQPDRQQEFAILRERAAALVQGQNVLELACGSGYWTGALAETASFVLATRATNRPAGAHTPDRRQGWLADLDRRQLSGRRYRAGGAHRCRRQYLSD